MISETERKNRQSMWTGCKKEIGLAQREGNLRSIPARKRGGRVRSVLFRMLWPLGFPDLWTRRRVGIHSWGPASRPELGAGQHPRAMATDEFYPLSGASSPGPMRNARRGRACARQRSKKNTRYRPSSGAARRTLEVRGRVPSIQFASVFTWTCGLKAMQAGGHAGLLASRQPFSAA